MKTFITLFLLMAVYTATRAQQKISGKVTDAYGQPLANASVFIAESKTGTTADTAGNFALPVPAGGKFKLVASYIGYQTQVRAMQVDNESRFIKFELKPVSKQLNDIVVKSRSTDNWKQWGKVFTEAFIGNSAFAAHCVLLNHEVVGFDYDKATKTLKAYATEPILVKNEDLGYLLTINLVEFALDTANNDLDYQGYYLFKELPISDGKPDVWEQNRRRAYSLSFMHFIRAVQSGKLKEEGFEVREFKTAGEVEKERIKKIYDQKIAFYTDSLDGNSKQDARKLADKSFNKDSLKYYKTILGKNNEIKLSEPLNIDDIAIKNNGRYTALKFNNHIQVAYKKIKEPEEYYKFKNQAALNTSNIDSYASGITANKLVMPQKAYPYTELRLTKGLPVEITETGYINNTNLYMNGFWGWWEKIATKLPYDYQPY